MVLFPKPNININLEKTFKEYYSPLCNYAFSIIPDKNFCEDIVQDIFLKIWDRPPQISTSVSSYLYKAVKNSCIDHLKKGYTNSMISLDEIEDPMDSPMEINREKNLLELKEKVETAINNLPPKCREIFLMRRNMEMSYDEISTILNISKKTIENHMNSAIRKIRAQLSKSDLLIYFLLFGKINKNNLQ